MLPSQAATNPRSCSRRPMSQIATRSFRSSMSTPADWQLPPGVSREVWAYLHDSSIADHYDESLTGTPLLNIDQQFVQRHCSTIGRVVDLGCGTGRIAIPLARSGHRVIGVDLSQEMLRVASAKAAAAGSAIEFVHANIAETLLLPDSSFDYAVCMFATLGMISGAEARQRVLANAFQLLRPGGIVLYHVHARWHHLRTGIGRRWLIRDLGRRFLGRRNAGDWPMPHHNGQVGWTMHLFTRAEAVGLARMAGFKIVEVQPVSMSQNGRLRIPWFLGQLRAYGFLIAARKPES